MRHESERESARATGGRTRFFAPHPNPDRSRSAEQQRVGCRLMVRGRRAQSQWTLSRQMARRASVSATLASPTWTTVVMETHSMRQSWMPPSSATLSRRYERVGCTCRTASSLNSRVEVCACIHTLAPPVEYEMWSERTTLHMLLDRAICSPRPERLFSFIVLVCLW